MCGCELNIIPKLERHDIYVCNSLSYSVATEHSHLTKYSAMGLFMCLIFFLFVCILSIIYSSSAFVPMSAEETGPGSSRTDLVRYIFYLRL